MTAKLAIPTFIGGAKDDLATLDIYDESAADAVINSIQDEYLGDVEALSDEALLELVGGQAMAEAAAEALPKELLQLPTESDVLARISEAVPELSSSLLDMSALGKADLLSSVTANMPSLSSITANIGGVTSSLTGLGGGFGDIRAVTGMVGRLSGSAVSLTDVGGLTSTLSAVVSRASGMGIPNAFGAVTSYSGITTRLGSLAGPALGQIAQRSLPAVIRSGDLGSLSSMASSLGVGGLSALVPNPVGMVARNFNMPRGSTLSDYEQACQVAQSTFNEMQPGWNTARIGGVTLPSITAFQGASPDFSRMIRTGAMLSSDPVQKLQLLTSVPGAGSVTNSLTRNFTQSVIGAGSRLVSSVTDPRVVNTAVPDVNRQVLQGGAAVAEQAPWVSNINGLDDSTSDRLFKEYVMSMTPPISLADATELY